MSDSDSDEESYCYYGKALEPYDEGIHLKYITSKVKVLTITFFQMPFPRRGPSQWRSRWQRMPKAAEDSMGRSLEASLQDSSTRLALWKDGLPANSKAHEVTRHHQKHSDPKTTWTRRILGSLELHHRLCKPKKSLQIRRSGKSR